MSGTGIGFHNTVISMYRTNIDNKAGCFAFGLGLATQNRKGEYLESYFPAPLHNLPLTLGQSLKKAVGSDTLALTRERLEKLKKIFEASGIPSQVAVCDRLAAGEKTPVAVLLEADEAIKSVPGAYLKLHLLSHRFVLPNSMNLDDLFAYLPTVAWTDRGAIDPAELQQEILNARLAGEHLVVHGLDKFPRLLDYVVPSGVRIADASRVRLGAYLGNGTTVMHEGFLNFNSGTVGPNMVEGRISQGVMVGAHTDLGGGSSTMGTLSGGGDVTVTIGENCLIGANGGTGIPLGNRCTIEAGLYITAGTPVLLIESDNAGADQVSVKARELAGQDDLLFIRNARTGQVECRTNRRAIELNKILHAHN